MARIDYPEFVNFAQNQYYENKNNDHIPLHLQTGVYASVLKRAEDEEILNEFLKMYSNSEVSDEQDIIRASFGQVCNEDLINKVLKLSLGVID